MVQHEIIGDDMQAVVLTLAQGDVVRAEAGAMMYMTDGIDMDAKMEGGLLGGLKRKLLAGESFFITYFRCTRPSARVAFAGPHPGKIIPMQLNAQTVCARRTRFSARRATSTSPSRSHSGSARDSSAARVSSCRSSKALALPSSTPAAPWSS